MENNLTFNQEISYLLHKLLLAKGYKNVRLIELDEIKETDILDFKGKIEIRASK